MVQILFTMILIFVLVVCAYYGVIYLIRLWTKCSKSEAEKKIEGFFRKNALTEITQDISVLDDIWMNIQRIMGEERVNKLRDIAQTGAIISTFGSTLGLPCVILALDIENDIERTRIKAIAEETLKKHLRARGLSTLVMSIWGQLNDLKLDTLTICFSRTEEEQISLFDQIINRNRKDKDVNDDELK